MKPGTEALGHKRRSVIKCGTPEWEGFVRTQYEQALAVRRVRSYQEQIHQPIWWEHCDTGDISTPSSPTSVTRPDPPPPPSTGAVTEVQTTNEERPLHVAAAPDVVRAHPDVAQCSPAPARGGHPAGYTEASAERPARRSQQRHVRRDRSRSAPARHGRQERRYDSERLVEEEDRRDDVLFYPFGQASEKMLTHNVRAPHDQVYPAALRALQLRRVEARQRLESSRERLERQAQELLELSCLQRDRDIWKTEYQRQYG